MPNYWAHHDPISSVVVTAVSVLRIAQELRLRRVYGRAIGLRCVRPRPIAPTQPQVGRPAAAAAPACDARTRATDRRRRTTTSTVVCRWLAAWCARCGQGERLHARRPAALQLAPVRRAVACWEDNAQLIESRPDRTDYPHPSISSHNVRIGSTGILSSPHLSLAPEFFF